MTDPPVKPDPDSVANGSQPKQELHDLFHTSSPRPDPLALPDIKAESKVEVEDKPSVSNGADRKPPAPASSSSSRPGPQLIGHLPTAWDEAHETFEALEKCVYENKGLGLSREQDEMMVCDCVYDKGESVGWLLDGTGVLAARGDCRAR